MKFYLILLGTLTCVAYLFDSSFQAPMSFCPPGWNETDYRCYYLLSSTPMTFSAADDACAQLGTGARVAYPADDYELALLGEVASGLSIWLGYLGDGAQFKTVYSALGFPNQFGTASAGACALYDNTGTVGTPVYSLSSQSCTATAAAICQMSYCSPVANTDQTKLWIEYKLNCYLMVNSATDYQTASDYCRSQNAELAVAGDQDEHNFMLTIYGSPKPRWIGVKSEIDAAGDPIGFIDVSTGEEPATTFWDGGTAPAKPASNTTCAYLAGSNSGDGWVIDTCSSSKQYMCKRVLGSLSFGNCTKGIMGKYTSWSADCVLSPGSQTRRWRKCIVLCQPRGCLQVTGKYCQFQPKWAEWAQWTGCSKPTKGSFKMAETPCLFYGVRTRSRECMCGTEKCGGCGSPGDSAGAVQTANCNIYKSELCPAQECTYCSTQFKNTHCYEDNSGDSLTNNFRCVCNLGYYKYASDIVGPKVPMGCTYTETSDDNAPVAECDCAYSYDECKSDYHSCTSEQLCQYPDGGPHTCYCLPGYRKIPSGGCVAASRIPPQCKIVSGSSFNKNARGNPLIPYERGYICTCGETKLLVEAGYSTRNSTSGEEAAARIISRTGNYMCYCFRATVGSFLRVDEVTNRPVETKFNLTRQFMEAFPECEMGYFMNNITYPQIPADLFTDVDAKLADLQKRTYFKCTGAEGFNSRFEYLTQPVLGEALSPPLEEPNSELEALTRLLSVDEAAIDLFQSMLTPDCETQRSYLVYDDVMSGTQVFIGNVSESDTEDTFVQMLCGNWTFPPKAVDRTNYPGAYQPLIAHCYPNATKFKSLIYNRTAAEANQTTLNDYVKQASRQKGLLSFTYTQDFTLPEPRINSGVMSISTNPEILKMPADVYLKMWIPLHEAPVGHFQPHCTFYDFGYIEGPTWRTEESGCTSKYHNISTDNAAGYVECNCTHMTIFSVTMIEVIPDYFKLAALILAAIVIGGSALSILCLALTLLIYIQLRKFSTERIGIMLLCIAIGMTQALLLAGAKLTVSPGTCRLISIMLHFFGLITFSLIASLSLAMYFRFVSRFKKGWLNSFCYYALGFAIPITTVAVTAGGFYDSYGVGYSCWMDMEGLIKWAFFVPFMIIGILSLFLLLKTAPILYKVKTSNVKSFSQAEVYGVEFKYGVQRKEKVEVIFEVSRKKFWALIILLGILTVTWVLGIMAMQYDSVYYDYGFAIFNASQGFFIFIMFCVREDEVRILCCAGCMTKQQPAGKISWQKFVDIYERYFALVLHNEEKEKKKMTFTEFVSQEYNSGAIMPNDIMAMDSHEYVSAQKGLAKPNYLLTCSCCFPVRTAPMPVGIANAPPPIDFNQKLFVVGPDGQLICLDNNGENAGDVKDEFHNRPGSMNIVTGSAMPGGRQVEPPGPEKVPEPVSQNWAPPAAQLFPEFPDSDEEGDVAGEYSAQVQINRDMMPKSEPEPPQRAPSARPQSARSEVAPADDEDDDFNFGVAVEEDNNYGRPTSSASQRPVSSRSKPGSARPKKDTSELDPLDMDDE